MLSSKIGLFFLFLLPLQLFGLTGAAVQWRADAEIYSSRENFERAVNKMLDSCGPADLVIFPEYTSVFTAYFLSPEIELDDLKQSSEQVKIYLNDFWGKQAQSRGIWILPGTYLEASGGQLFNTALLYNPQGQEVLSQRKCFLGAPEMDFGLSPGEMEEVEPFEIGEITLALTICRDTYNSVWEEHFPPVDFWIDIKANELPYSQEYFQGALPSRLPAHPVDQGLTLSLVGSMLGYQFSGISSWYRQDKPVLESWSSTEESILFFPMEPQND